MFTRATTDLPPRVRGARTAENGPSAFRGAALGPRSSMQSAPASFAAPANRPPSRSAGRPNCCARRSWRAGRLVSPAQRATHKSSAVTDAGTPCLT